MLNVALHVMCSYPQDSGMGIKLLKELRLELHGIRLGAGVISSCQDSLYDKACVRHLGMHGLGCALFAIRL